MSASRRLGRALIRWVLVPGLVLLVGLLSLALALQLHLAGQLGRIPEAFAGLDDRPAPTSQGGGAVNVLVAVTTGSGGGQPRWNDGAGSDLVLVLHLDADRRAGSVVLLPSDGLVDVPGRGRQPLASAFSSDRPALAVEAVEHLTGLRIDHLTLMSRQGLRELAERAEGLDETMPESSTGSLPERVQEAHFLQRLAEETLHTRMRKRPLEVYRTLDIVTRNASVEEHWSSFEMLGLVISLRDLRSSNIGFLVSPVSADGMIADARETDLWSAVASGRTGEWLAGHPELAASAPRG